MSDVCSIDEQVDKLDIQTINAECRAYLAEFLRQNGEHNNHNGPSSSGFKQRPALFQQTSLDLEDPHNGHARHSSGSRKHSGPPSIASSTDSSNFNSPLKFFRKIRSGRSNKSDTASSGSGGKSDLVIEETMSPEDLKHVTVTALPQLFLGKYLGYTTCIGLKGISAIRNPVDRLIEAVGRLKMGEDLPLMNVVFSGAGVRADSHYLNKGVKLAPLVYPIESISYGVQDVKFCRVFALIIVREVAENKVTKAECHAFICANPISTRKMALSLGLCFQSLTRRLTGQEVYSVDLRTPDEIARIRTTAYRNEADA